MEMKKKKLEQQYLYLKKWTSETKAIRLKRPLHNTKGIQLTRRYNPCKYVRTNKGALKYMKNILVHIKRGSDRNTVIVGDFDTPLLSMDRSSKQKINKAAETLNDTLDQVDLIDI